MEIAYNDLLEKYKHPLIWKFTYDNIQRITMYKNNEIPNPTFFIFHIIYNKYYLDIGYLYEYGDNDHNKYNSFGYYSEITDKIEIIGDKYLEFLKHIDKYTYIFGNYVDYEIINKNEYIPDEEYSIITQNDNIIMYKYDINLYFINDTEKINFIKAYIQMYINQ